ncbi:MAG: Clp protease ClpP [Candidatus Parcubacteria bacterium]|nr:Clp protease ClpP [Candidatus Parcubacteria bacterium]
MPYQFKNPIWVNGPIDNKDFFTVFTKRFSELISQTKAGDDITVFINSPGGDTHTSLGIYDLLKKSDRNIIGVVSGIAYSGASLILQGCEKRLMTANSRVMLHKSTVQVTGSVINAQAALDTFKSLDDKYYEIYAERSGDKIEHIADMANQDKYFDANKAFEAKLIDEIL